MKGEFASGEAKNRPVGIIYIKSTKKKEHIIKKYAN